MANLFKDFDTKPFMKRKPPSDNSFDTDQELKQLAKTPINKKFITDKDDVESTFKKTAKDAGVEYPSKLVKKLMEDSTTPILKLKKHFNRPRPHVLAKKKNMKLEHVELKSMKTPSYPSGHSAQGALIGEALADMYPKAAKKFRKAGKDISDSRNSARAHYKSDSKFGMDLGKEMYKHYKDIPDDSPMKCWKGYERVPGTAKGSKGSCRKKSPMKKQKGGGTTKTCLPAAKIRGLSKEKRQQLVSSKRSAGAQGKYKRSSKTNVKGARKKGATLRDWFQKEDWRRVDDPSKKCGE
tara:strand:+ start:644 stop:1528 length:885 start_codon:yes stop_codon:yes gene_type:complete